MKTPTRRTLAVLALCATAAAGALWASARGTENDIAAHHAAVRQAAAATGLPQPSADAMAALPAPVRRYLAYALPGPLPAVRHVEVRMRGDFRRPRHDAFQPTTAEQTLAATTPALMFSATTPILPGVWARAYDAYVDGRMDMKAKLLSALTVLDEPGSPTLDRISLRRWLLESPLFPVALLPGGAVRWEPVDARRARAVVERGGVTASLVATFGPDGALLRFDAEEDGDLGTPYHGSGEHGARSDYRLVQGMRIPMRFSIARAAGGAIHPFWRGEITDIRFGVAGP